MKTSAILLNDTSVNHHHGCHKVVDNISIFFNSLGVAIIYKHAVGNTWKNNSTFNEKLDEADILIINAEGTIHHNSTRGRILLEAVVEAKKYGKLVLLLNMTYQSNPVEFKEYLAQADLITVRESLSLAELNKLGIKAMLVPDFTFYDVENYAPIKADRKHCLVTDSVFQSLSLSLFNFADSNEGFKFRPILSKNPNDKLWSHYSTRFIKFPSKMTLKLLVTRPKTFYKEYKLNNTLYKKHTIENTKAYIDEVSKANGIITARFHALCFAIQQRNKFLTVVSNSHKVEGLLKDIGLDDKRVMLDIHGKVTATIPDYTKEEKMRIQEYIQFSKNAFENLYVEIKNLIYPN